ncbi:integrator complex subunit 1 [Brachionus plicatilis]|uniref:Integrator complex subunit 1 n=1 Tax=Brachionus plicatilis TaxID=10195 RepID=A0A3M7QS79_BRAPC|nr:integrator complex subunit 1 [Brachionus plicatilis]
MTYSDSFPTENVLQILFGINNLILLTTKKASICISKNFSNFSCFVLGFDPPGNNYIALGSRTRDSSNPNFNSETQRSNTLNSQNEANLAQSNISISISNKSKIPSNNSSSNFGSLSNSNFHLNTGVASHDQYAVDAKNVKEEVVRLLEKDDTTDKLIKFIESLVNNLKHPNISFSAANLKQYSQQSDLNFLMALSYIALKRPQFFLKNLNLVDFIVNNLLTSKNTSYDKTVAKNKQTQPIRSPSSPSQNVLYIQPVICNILAMVFENECNWPEVFVTAFVYDSVGERCWVENPLCKDFVENIKTAFVTRPIPFSCENSNTQLIPNNSNSSIELINAKSVESDSILEATEGFVDFTNKKSQIAPRYENIRSKIETTLVDLVKKILNAGTKGQAYKRAIGQSSIASTVNTDNKNIIKLLHNLCGVSELRKIASQKIEVWITNPKG